MSMDVLNKKELSLRLKHIKNEKIEYVKEPKPHCLFIYETTVVGNCERCGESLQSYRSDIDCYYYRALKSKVKIMAEMGYDVKFELFCYDCISDVLDKRDFFQRIFGKKKIKVVDIINCLFSIKLLGEKKYHKVMSNDINDYNAVLALLKNKPTWFGVQGEIYLLREETDRVKWMLGI